ncbi:MAG: helix-turn-helix transcriptional regulator [Pseudonocardiaceae bacterium]
MGTTGPGGARVAELRKRRDITQVALARRVGVSVSLLSKIEIGDRTLTPSVAAAIARALQISLGALYGEAEIAEDQSVLLEDLRTAVRRYDIPDQAPAPDSTGLRVDVDRAITLREQADLAGLLRMLPGLRHGHTAPARHDARGTAHRSGAGPAAHPGGVDRGRGIPARLAAP